MNEKTCALCDVELDDMIDEGERCQICRADLCYNCSMGYGRCQECFNEDYEEDNEGYF